MNGMVGWKASTSALAPPVTHRLSRARIGHVPLDLLRLDEVLARLERLIASGQGGRVLLPGVEQVLRAEHDEALREALATADVCLAGSAVMVRAASVLGTPVPEPRAGAGWLPPLAALARQRGWRVLVVADRPGVAEWAAGALRDRHGLLATGVSAVGLPPQGLGLERLVERIALTRPDLVLVSLATPQQELFCQAAAARLRPAVLVGLGSALESLDGRRKARLPGLLSSLVRWMSQRLALGRVLARTGH